MDICFERRAGLKFVSTRKGGRLPRPNPELLSLERAEILKTELREVWEGSSLNDRVKKH